MANRPVPSRGSAFGRVSLIVGILAVYLAWPSRTLSEAEDVLTFIAAIESGAPRLHPNHLLFEPMQALVHRVGAALWPDLSVALSMRLLSTACAGLALWSVWSLVERRRGAVAAATATGFVAASFGFWHYSSVGDAYIPALALALCACDRLEASGTRGPAAVAVSAALTAAAVLVHQLYVFFAVLGGLYLLTSGPRALAGRVMRAGLFGAIAGGVVLGAYLAAHASVVAAGAAPSGFIDWAKGHAENGLWLPPSLLTPLLAAAGAGTALVTAIPAFGVPVLRGVADALSGDRLIVEEVSVAESALSVTGAAVLTFLSAVALLATLVLALAMIRAALAGPRPRDRFDVFLVAVVLVYAGLATIWEAINKEFWIHVLCFGAIAAARLVPPVRAPAAAEGGTRIPGRNAALWSAAILSAAVVNFFGAIRPYADPDNDYWARQTHPVAAVARPGAVVFITCPWLCTRHLELRHGVVIAGTSGSPQASDGEVFLTSWTIMPSIFPEDAFQGLRRRQMQAAAALAPLPVVPEAAADIGSPMRLWRLEDGRWRPVATPPAAP